MLALRPGFTRGLCTTLFSNRKRHNVQMLKRISLSSSCDPCLIVTCRLCELSKVMSAFCTASGLFKRMIRYLAFPLAWVPDFRRFFCYASFNDYTTPPFYTLLRLHHTILNSTTWEVKFYLNNLLVKIKILEQMQETNFSITLKIGGMPQVRLCQPQNLDIVSSNPGQAKFFLSLAKHSCCGFDMDTWKHGNKTNFLTYIHYK